MILVGAELTILCVPARTRTRRQAGRVELSRRLTCVEPDTTPAITAASKGRHARHDACHHGRIQGGTRGSWGLDGQPTSAELSNGQQRQATASMATDGYGHHWRWLSRGFSGGGCHVASVAVAVTWLQWRWVAAKRVHVDGWLAL